MKAQSLSINVVIIVAIGLSVLLFVGTFLSGGFKSMSEKISTFGRESTSADTSATFVKCNTLCAAWVSQDCDPNKKGDLTAGLCKVANDAELKETCGCT